jgi:hypothetical protein
MAPSRKTPSTPASKTGNRIKPDQARVSTDGTIVKPDQKHVKAPGAASKVAAPGKASKPATKPRSLLARSNLDEVPVSKHVRAPTKAVPSILQSLDAWAPDETPGDPKPLNLLVEAELHRQFKAYAVIHDTTISRLLRALIARELDSEGA